MPAPVSPGEMIRRTVDNMKKDTGKTFEQWVKLAKKEGPDKHMKLLNWLKDEFGLKRYQAQFIATEVLNPGKIFEYEQPNKLVDELYSGKREALRPIYDKVCEKALAIKEVSEVVCKTYTSFRNNVQFAVIKPTTQTAVDLAFYLPDGTAYSDRLVEAKNIGGGDKMKHRVRLESAKDVDAEVVKWLKAAAKNGIERK